VSDEVLVNVTPRETRVAIVENGLLQEVHVERASKRGLVGNIYRGEVSRILPGMQAAFVDIGLERTAFLHAADIQSEGEAGEEGAARKPPENIASLLHEGQRVLVQVIKDPLGTKGARLTMHITIPSRYLVYVPDMNGLRVRAPSSSPELVARIEHYPGRAPDLRPVLGRGRDPEARSGARSS
jgi:ribonuclease G